MKIRLSRKHAAGSLLGYYDNYSLENAIGKLISLYGEKKVFCSKNDNDGKSTVDISLSLVRNGSIIARFSLYNYKNSDCLHIGGKDPKYLKDFKQILDQLLFTAAVAKFDITDYYTGQRIYVD